MMSLKAMTARMLARLTRLEGLTATLDSLSDADLDLCIATLQRAIRREDGETLPVNPDDERANALLARLRRGEASL